MKRLSVLILLMHYSTRSIVKGCSGLKDLAPKIDVPPTPADLKIGGDGTGKPERDVELKNTTSYQNITNSTATSYQNITNSTGTDNPAPKQVSETNLTSQITSTPKIKETTKMINSTTSVPKATTVTTTTTTTTTTTFTTTRGPSHKLLVVGGDTAKNSKLVSTNNVEMFAIRDLNLDACPSPPPYPKNVYEHFGDVYQGKLTICGGIEREGKTEPYKECYQFDADTNTWHEFPSMQEGRYGAVAIAGPKGFLVVGGHLKNRPTKTTALFNGSGWKPWTSYPFGEKVPISHAYNCMVHLNRSHTLTFIDSNRDIYIFNWNTGNWSNFTGTKLPNGNYVTIPMCSRLDENRLLLMGRHIINKFMTSYVYDTDADAWTIYKYGPLNASILATLVTLNGRPFLVGGMVMGDKERPRDWAKKELMPEKFLDTIYTPSTEQYSWKTLTPGLALPRAKLVAAIVETKQPGC